MKKAATVLITFFTALPQPANKTASGDKSSPAQGPSPSPMDTPDAHHRVSPSNIHVDPDDDGDNLGSGYLSQTPPGQRNVAAEATTRERISVSPRQVQVSTDSAARNQRFWKVL